MAFESPAAFNQASSYSAEQARRAWFSALARTAAGNPGIINGGLLGVADLQLSAPASGMSVNVATGECIVGGTEGGAQGGYYARNSAQLNLVVSASNTTNPRIDLVCVTISDSGYTEPSGGSGNQVNAQVLTGTPTAGATLSNLNGAPSLPLSSLLLGYILVPANSTNVTAGNISNVAPLATLGLSPFTYVKNTGNANVAAGQWVVASGGTTQTLPAPVANTLVAVSAAASGVSGSSQVLVSASSGVIIDVSTTYSGIVLGSTGQSIILQGDGSNWHVISGHYDTGWVGITLAASWSQGGGFYTVSYRRLGDFGYLRGSAINGTGGGSTAPFASALPVVLRPAQQSGGAAFSGAVTISTGGVVSVPSVANGSFFIFDGLIYPLV